jgi:hypothetical protein
MDAPQRGKSSPLRIVKLAIKICGDERRTKALSQSWHRILQPSVLAIADSKVLDKKVPGPHGSEGAKYIKEIRTILSDAAMYKDRRPVTLNNLYRLRINAKAVNLHRSVNTPNAAAHLPTAENDVGAQNE